MMRMYLTEEGREVLRRLPGINEQLRRRVHNVLSENEFEELRRMLGAIGRGDEVVGLENFRVIEFLSEGERR